MTGDKVLGIVFGGIAITFFCMAWVGPRYSSIHGDEARSPRLAPVGTAGHAPFLDTAVSEDSMRTIRMITAADDPPQLVGRRIDLDLKAPYLVDPRAFWVGSNDDRVLVVFARDVTTKPKTGQPIRISGKVREIPSIEEQISWGLDAHQRQEVEQEKVYILADAVTAR